MTPRSSRGPLVLALLLIAACTDGDKDPDGFTNPGSTDGGSSDGGADGGGTTDGGSTGRDLALSFLTTPAESVLSGDSPGSVVVALVDANSGAAVTDLTLRISLSADGGELEGTTSLDLVAGEASFDDLRLPGCWQGALIATASQPAVDQAVSSTLQVAPLVTVLSAPGPAARTGALDPLVVALEDAAGAAFDLDLVLSDDDSDGVLLSGSLDQSTEDGVARFDDLSATGSGSLRPTLLGPAGCPLAEPLPELWVGEDLRVEPVFLPSARLGQDYAAGLPSDDLILRDLPDGLALSGGWITGVPTDSQAVLMEGATWDDDGPGGTVVDLQIRLALLPADDADLPAPDDDAAEPGPYPTDALTLVIPEIRTSGGTSRNVPVRLAFPSDGAGGIAAGRFPVIAFHHAAHSPADIYDDYTDLHGHWASHGVLVASVDSSVNVSGVSQSWQNLTDMSTFQLATVDLLADLDADSSSALAGHVDTRRVFVSGHSRGGGASLISLWREPSLLGALCLEQVSPLQTPSQDWGDPEGNGDRAFPNRPILIMVGSLDLDEAWPLVDVSYEQTVGPAALVTIHGANHEDSYDAGTAGGTTSSSTIPITARHDLDQHYTTAWLRRFGGAGEAAGDLAYELPLFGQEALSSGLSAQGVSVHGRRHAAQTLMVDDFQDAGEPHHNLLGGDNIAANLDAQGNDEPYEDGLRAVGRYDERGIRIGTWARARRLSWSSAEAELALWLDPDGAALDLSQWEGVALRVARDCPSPYSGPCPSLEVDIELALWDADGVEASVALSEGMGDLGVVGRHWSTALLSLDAFPGVDPTRIEGIALRLGAAGWTDGDLWIDDLRLR